MCSALQKRGGLLLKDTADIGFRIKRLNRRDACPRKRRSFGIRAYFRPDESADVLKKRSGNRCLQKELEEAFCVRHPTMAGIIKRLGAKGLVVSEVDGSDRRMRMSAYEKGRIWRRRLTRRITSPERPCCAGLPGSRSERFPDFWT